MKRKMLVIVAMIAMIFSLSVVSAKEVEVNDAATLLAAFKNAESGDVVKLIDNITYAGSGIMVEGKKTVTLDMNGFNITIDPTINEKDEQGQYRSITVNDSTLIIKGKGTITHETHSAINVWGKETEDAEFASKLVVEKDVTLKGKQGIAIFWDTKMGAHGVTVDFGGKIEATVHGITIQGIIKNAEGAPVINILDGAVINSEQTGLYAAGNGTWNIGNANITGKESAIGIKSGKVIINGGTFTCTGESQMPTEGYSNGINASGAAIQLESNKDYYGNVELIIKDGTFTSYEITPEQFGYERCEKGVLTGGTPQENAQITLDIISGKELGAKRNAVCLNAGAAIYLAGKADSIEAGVRKAEQIIDEGLALKKLEQFKEESNK